jgi:hypothetical protein
MGKIARSARGTIVDFDLLAIKEQLATAPVPVSVDQRRKFIDEKDGVKTRQTLPSALVMAAEGANESAAAKSKIKAKA